MRIAGRRVKRNPARLSETMDHDTGDATMKLEYFAETDSLYVEFRDRPGIDSRQISERVVVDYDAAGCIVGIDIDNAGYKIALERVLLKKLPAVVEVIAPPLRKTP